MDPRDVRAQLTSRSLGVETAKELHQFLKTRGKVDEYPLFTFVVRGRFALFAP